MKPSLALVAPVAALAGMLCLLPTAGAGEATQAAPGASVDSLLEVARARNPEFAALRHEAQAFAERVLPASALPDPTLRAELQDVTNRGADANPNLLPARVGATKYTLIQALPAWGSRDLQRDIAGAEADQARGQARASWAELAARIKAAYAGYHQAGRAIALTREILDIAATIERTARARHAAGLAPQQDALRAQTEITGLRGELIVLETERHHLHARLNTLLGRAPGETLAEPMQPRPLPISVRLDHAALETRLENNSPQLAVEQARIVAAEKGRALIEKNRYPSVSLGISPIQMGSRIREWELMVEMNIPLQQESRRAEERAGAARLDAAHARQAAVQDRLRGELAEQLAALDGARRLGLLAEQSLLPQAEIGFKTALAGYEHGRLDFAALLDAQRLLRKARLDGLKAQTEAQLRLADIERMLGEEL